MLKDVSYREKLGASHVYSLGSVIKRPWLIYICIAMLVQPITSLIGAIHDQHMQALWVNGAIILLYCLLGALIWRSGIKRQLIVGDEGIIYVNGTYILYAPWHTISQVVLSPHTGEPALYVQLPIEELPLEQGIGEQRATIKSRLRTRRPLQITSRYDIYNYIPLPAKKAGLWQDVQQHLPQLAIKTQC